MTNPRISIIGTGALGSVLAKALASKALPVKSLFNRSRQKADTLSKQLEVEHSSTFPQEIDELGNVIFLTVPDRHIKGVAKKLAALADDFSGHTVIHASGNYSSQLLNPLKENGAATATFHPLQTFTEAAVVSDFEGIYADVEGDAGAVAFLNRMADELGCHVLEIDPAAKPYLHAAAVMASNYMVALIESAGQVARLGGLEKREALKALMPLAQKSMANIASSTSLSEALSGPIARGDAATVKVQIDLLSEHPDLETLYRLLGKQLVEIKQESSNSKSGKLKAIAEILDHGNGAGGTK